MNTFLIFGIWWAVGLVGAILIWADLHISLHRHELSCPTVRAVFCMGLGAWFGAITLLLGLLFTLMSFLNGKRFGGWWDRPICDLWRRQPIA